MLKGIGEKRKIALLKHFKSIENIKKATVEELAEVESMNKKKWLRNSTTILEKIGEIKMKYVTLDKLIDDLDLK